MLLRNVLQVRRQVCRTPAMAQKRTFLSETFMKFSQSSLVKGSMDHLMSIHEMTGLPWWSNIILVTVGFRALITLPLMINQKKIFERYESLGPEIEAISLALRRKYATQAKAMHLKVSEKTLYNRYRLELMKETQRLIVRDNCSPYKAGILPFLQIPVWLTLSLSYRNMAHILPDPKDLLAQETYRQLSREGTLWFSNLTLPDPTGILPIANGVVNLINIQLHVNERRALGIKETTLMKILTNGSRLICFAVIPIGLTFPADVTLYWVSSACFGIAQTLAFRNDKVKQILGFTDTVEGRRLKKELVEKRKAEWEKMLQDSRKAVPEPPRPKPSWKGSKKSDL